MNQESLDKKLALLSKEAKELYLFEHIETLQSCPTPIEFLRHYVMPNKPVVIRNGASHWPAINKWSLQYFNDLIGEKIVTVSFTPNGLADAPIGECFLLPDDVKMKYKEVVHFLKENDPCDVAYVQSQNSNFMEEFQELVHDTEGKHVKWASEALGKSPDAVNMWIGNKYSVTSTHKDHYENLYAVVSGSKTFLLYPPTDQPCFTYNQYQLAKYKRNKNAEYSVIGEPDNNNLCSQCKNRIHHANLILKNEILKRRCFYQNCNPNINSDIISSDYSKTDFSEAFTADKMLCNCESSKVPWISDDPLSKSKSAKFLSSNALEVTLYPGDLLYLPSLWFHHVRQSNDTIAVNYWYDMEYDIKYNYFKFVESFLKD